MLTTDGLMTRLIALALGFLVAGLPQRSHAQATAASARKNSRQDVRSAARQCRFAAVMRAFGLDERAYLGHRLANR